MTIDLDKCRECEESRCILSTYYEMNKEEIKEAKELKAFKEYERIQYNKKIREYYLNETEYYEKLKKREHKLTNYERMNKSDRMHQNVWDLAINKQMELQERYYNSIKY